MTTHDHSADHAPATRLAQALGHVDPQTAALIPPIHGSTTYLRDADGGYRSGLIYARADNPTFRPAENLLASLENGADAMVFASGMAAATAVVSALKPGDHVVAPTVMYWSFRNWLLTRARDWGVQVDLVATDDLGQLAAAMKPGQTKLVWLETPSNPLWTLSDIAAAATIAHDVGARLAVDSTVATPIHSQPLDRGADLVMHSATKYLNGYSDVIAGALVTAREDAFWDRLRAGRGQGGAILGAYEAALLLRGMRTLHLRVRESSRNALYLAERLRDHPGISGVLYPGLPDHPGHAVAAAQIKGGFGGMLSIRLTGGEAAAVKTAAATRLWKRATSLGGVESLIEHRASIEGADTPVPFDLLRLSVGIEDRDDLLADLTAAIEQAGGLDG